MNDHYCPLIFKGMYVERHSAETSAVAPCCAATGETVDNSQVNFDTNPLLLRLRRENQAGLASKECHVCWDQEKYTGRSLRTSSIEYYAKSQHNPYQVSGLQNLDWNVEPICNAKCVICSSYHSSAWAAENQKFDPDMGLPIRTASAAKSNSIIDAIDFSNTKRVYFNGGEPVLSQDPELILQRLANSGNLENTQVAFNMNGSCMPSNNMIALLKQAAHVTVIFSIDGTEQQFEYIRYPLKWDTVKVNIDKIMQLGFDQVCMATALGIHNLHIAQRTEDWWHNFTKNYRGQIGINNTFQLVVGMLSIKSASESLRHQMLKDFENVAGSAAELITNCLSACAGNDQWIGWLNNLDRRRDLNWRQTLPELYRATQLAGIEK
jgi:uncharacterized radical SAM superfamily Fe-S cluster-containing enzyme